MLGELCQWLVVEAWRLKCYHLSRYLRSPKQNVSKRLSRQIALLISYGTVVVLGFDSLLFCE